MNTAPPLQSVKCTWSILPAEISIHRVMHFVRHDLEHWAGVMGVPMKWEIARIFVVGTAAAGSALKQRPRG